MEQAIIDRYHDAILQKALQRYDIAHNQIRLLGASESFIYGFERASQSYILRITHTLHRSVALLQSEVDWINYLAAGDVSVAKAVLSAHGRLVEAIDDGKGGQFLATAFVEAVLIIRRLPPVYNQEGLCHKSNLVLPCRPTNSIRHSGRPMSPI